MVNYQITAILYSNLTIQFNTLTAVKRKLFEFYIRLVWLIVRDLFL